MKITTEPQSNDKEDMPLKPKMQSRSSGGRVERQVSC